jgi:anti-sigma regulatory factor (Ser/Thr protein kinase)
MPTLDAAGSAPRLDRTFTALPRSVAEARVVVAGWVRTSAPGEERLLEDVALAVSEACTNVVVHAYAGDATVDDPAFRVTAERTGATVCVVVSDDGRGMMPRPDSPGLGLGLPLMSTVADGLEIAPPPTGSGTVVTMRFSV